MARLLATLNDSFDDPLIGAQPYQTGVYRNMRRAPVMVDGRTGSVVVADGPRSPTSAQRGEVNAKTIDYKQPGAGASGYGVTEFNVGAKLGKLYQAYKVQGITEGGNESIFKAVESWAGTAGRLSPVNRKAFDTFLQTGDTAGLDPALAVKALDYGLREVGRQQQNKQGFFDTVIGKVINIGAQVAAAYFGGPWAAAAVGATTGGVQDGLKGAVIGGVSGYGIGKGVQWVKDGGLTNLVARATGNAPITNVNAAIGGDYAARAAAGASKAPFTWGGAVKGALTGAQPALNAVNTGINVRNILVGAGTTAAAYGIGQGLSAPNIATPAPAPAFHVAPAELEAERLRRRRTATKVNFTWGKPLLGTVARPVLGGAA